MENKWYKFITKGWYVLQYIHEGSWALQPLGSSFNIPWPCCVSNPLAPTPQRNESCSWPCSPAYFWSDTLTSSSRPQSASTSCELGFNIMVAESTKNSLVFDGTWDSMGCFTQAPCVYAGKSLQSLVDSVSRSMCASPWPGHPEADGEKNTTHEPPFRSGQLRTDHPSARR